VHGTKATSSLVMFTVLLVFLVVFGAGFAAGYGVREMIFTAAATEIFHDPALKGRPGGQPPSYGLTANRAGSYRPLRAGSLDPDCHFFPIDLGIDGKPFG
jgi:hypothetical protein